VWATAKTLEECRKNLKEVLEGWILLSMQKGIPVPRIGRYRIKPLESVKV
jgi:predicted RNase H-like HicB family nuclease